jgi:hypothetical protein
VQTKVEAELELAESVVNHLDSVALGDFVGSEGAFRSPRVGSGVRRTGDDGFGYDAIAWAAAEEDESDAGAHVGVVPHDIEGCSDGRVDSGIWGKDWVVGELSLFCLEYWSVYLRHLGVFGCQRRRETYSTCARSIGRDAKDGRDGDEPEGGHNDDRKRMSGRNGLQEKEWMY